MSAAPRRQLGLAVAAAIVIANMVGTGVFTTTGFNAQALHDPKTILLAWVVGGVLALCGAATYAELGAMMPRAGGEYVYLREAYHPAVGFMSGWASLTAGFSAPIAAAAVAFALYLAKLCPELADPTTQKIVAVSLIAVITCMHSIDTKFGGRVQTVFTAAKVVLILVFIIAGLTAGTGDWSHFDTRGGGYANITTTAFATQLMYISFAYSGWNAAAYIAGEIEKPARTLPRALLLGTGVVMALYVLLNVVFLYAVPTDVLAGPTDGFNPVKEVGAVAASSLFGARAATILTSVIALALVSAVSAMVMAGPRVYAAMARDHALPPQLSFHSKRGVPTVAVITQGVLAAGFAIVGKFDELVNFIGFTLAIFAALTVGAVFVFRRRGHGSTYRTFGYPVTPIVFIGFAAWIVYAQIKDRPAQAGIVALVLLVGAAIYAMAARGITPEPDEEEPAEAEILVPTAKVVDP